MNWFLLKESVCIGDIALLVGGYKVVASGENLLDRVYFRFKTRALKSFVLPVPWRLRRLGKWFGAYDD